MLMDRIKLKIKVHVENIFLKDSFFILGSFYHADEPSSVPVSLVFISYLIL